MKRIGALLFAIIIMLLSLESNLGMHFCHDILIESSINKQLSDCCGDAIDQSKPILSKPCCEIAYYTAALQDASFPDATVELTKLIAVTPVVQFVRFVPTQAQKQHYLFNGDPPESTHVELHILFEQYLI